jgi:hypothetical protein
MTAAGRDYRLPSPGTGAELDALAGSFNGLLERLHETSHAHRPVGDRMPSAGGLHGFSNLAGASR